MNTFPGVPVPMLYPRHRVSAHGEPYKILFPHLRAGKSIEGWLRNGCIYLPEYEERHDEIAALLKNHHTPVTDEQRGLLKDYMKKHTFHGFVPEDAVTRYQGLVERKGWI